MHFTDQHVYAIGTSDVFTDGILSASGSAQGPTRIPMDGKFVFAPSFQGGYFQRFGASDWLWGAKLTYNYLGSTSTNTNSIIPQFGSYTTIMNPTPVPFSGPAYVHAAKTSLTQEFDFVPFLGRAIGQSYVYAGVGPTLSQTRSQLNGLVGFAFVDGGIVDQSGVPQDFSKSSWLVGDAATIGATYFFTPTWFVDLNYTYAFTQGHTSNFAAPFVDQLDERRNIGRQFRLDGADATGGPDDEQGFLRDRRRDCCVLIAELSSATFSQHREQERGRQAEQHHAVQRLDGAHQLPALRQEARRAWR